MYHLSFSNLGPRTILDIKRPDRSYSEEKHLPERVCFALTIEQCICGIGGFLIAMNKINRTSSANDYSRLPLYVRLK